MALLVTFVATDKSNPPEAKKEKYSGRGRAPPLHTPTDSLCAIRAGGCGHPPLRNHRRRMRHTHGWTEPSRPYTRFPGGKIFPKQRPKAATYLCRFAAKARFDNRLKPQGKVSKGEGSHRPKAVEKEDSVKETHQGFLSRSIRKPIFALQKS